MAKAQRREQPAATPALRRLPVIVIAQNKGGVGKTTWTRILGEYFAMVRKVRVLLIDLDPQCSLSKRLLEMEADSLSPDGVLPPLVPDYDPEVDRGWDGRSSIANVFLGKPVVPYATQVSGIDVIPGDGQELRLVEQQRPEELQERVVSRIREFLTDPEVAAAYDIVLLDTPPSKGPLSQAALRSATHVLIPIEPAPQSLEGLGQMLAFWRSEQRRRERDDPLRIIGILPNKVKNVGLHQGLLQALRQDPELSGFVLKQEVGARVAFEESDHWEAKPKSVLGLAPQNPARVEAEVVCRHIEGEVFGNVTE